MAKSTGVEKLQTIAPVGLGGFGIGVTQKLHDWL